MHVHARTCRLTYGFTERLSVCVSETEQGKLEREREAMALAGNVCVPHERADALFVVIGKECKVIDSKAELI